MWPRRVRACLSVEHCGWSPFLSCACVCVCVDDGVECAPCPMSLLGAKVRGRAETGWGAVGGCAPRCGSLTGRGRCAPVRNGCLSFRPREKGPTMPVHGAAAAVAMGQLDVNASFCCKH